MAITLNEIAEITGVAPGRTVGEQVYDSSINTVSSNKDLGSDTYPGNITPYSDQVDPFYSGLQQFTQPIGSFYNNYGAPIAGGIMGLLTNIPGVGLLANKFGPKPYDNNLLNMYGGYGQGGSQDKFGYNTVSMMDNFLQPGSNSYRSYALEGLGGLAKDLAGDFYQQNYGKTFDQVKDEIQNKQNPFGPQPTNIGTSDYYGGEGGGGFADNSNASDPGGSNEMGSF